MTDDPQPGQRIEVLWWRGDPGTWYRGTGLFGGRVQLDDSHLFVPDGEFILEREEITEWRSTE